MTRRTANAMVTDKWIAKQDELTAQRDRLVKVLADVMEHLSATGGSPKEHRAFSAAYAELAQYGRGPSAKQREALEVAYAQWEARRAGR